MTQPDRQLNSPNTRKGGFALFVVLAGLLVLTALFATIQSRSMSALSRGATDGKLLAKLSQAEGLLYLAIALHRADPGIARHELPKGDILILQDVGGLIDLNSANPDLLKKLADHLGLEAAAMATLRDWRREGRRLLSVQDFARITGLADAAALPALATVFSGRTGIDPGTSPAPVQAIAGSPRIPLEYISPPSGTNMTVWHADTDSILYLGTIHSPPIGPPRILELG